MNAIGIMQGRLSAAGTRAQTFPRSWREEFRAARDIGFDAIEWIVTAATIDDNPLLVDPAGVVTMIDDSGIAVPSVCVDCCIELPIGQVPLIRIIDGAAAVGATCVTLPLLEGHALTGIDDLAARLREIAGAVSHARAKGVRLALESDLPAHLLRHVAKIDTCYDVGNAAARGVDAAAEILLLGDRVSAVHIKDRRRGDTSVPLGQGDVDFPRVVAALQAAGYAGPLILETPRGASPTHSACANLDFLKRQLAGAAAVA